MARPIYRRLRIPAALLVVALLATLGAVSVVRAATFNSPDAAALIADIATANGNGQDNTINLAPGGTYATGANNGAAGDENGLPVIASSGHTLTINGNGATLTNGAASARFFTVNSGSTLILNTLTISNGKIVAPDSNQSGIFRGGDAKGGAINNAGTVMASGVTFSGNSAVGGNSVPIPGCIPSPGFGCSRLPGQGFGGAIYSTGTLTLANTVFSGNSAIGGNATVPGDSTNFGAPSGGNAYGGAIRDTGRITASGGTFTNNSATGGTAAARGTSTGGGTGGFAYGGAISVASGQVSGSVTTSTFSGNSAAGGTGGGAPSSGGGGGLASGGAIDNTQNSSAGTLTVARSTFSGDHATGGAGGTGGHDAQFFAQSSGGAAYGGAISNYDAGALIVVNSTFTGETATGGNGGSGGTGIPGNGGNASGGAISENANPFSNSDAVTVINATIAANQAVAGTGASSGTAAGGGIYGHGNVSIANTLLSGNSGGTTTANCAVVGSYVDHGNNLEFGANTCTFTTGSPKNDQFGDPKLDALKGNGGPTQTMALLAGSAATGNGNPTICAAAPVSGIDQRGLPRPGGTCAIGAFEPQTGPPNPLPPPQPTVPVGVATPAPVPVGQPTGVPIANPTPLPLPPRR